MKRVIHKATFGMCLVMQNTGNIHKASIQSNHVQANNDENSVHQSGIYLNHSQLDDKYYSSHPHLELITLHHRDKT